jgi:hypothetical protein
MLSARPEFVTTDDRAREDRILREMVAGNASAEFHVGIGNDADRGRQLRGGGCVWARTVSSGSRARSCPA